MRLPGYRERPVQLARAVVLQQSSNFNFLYWQTSLSVSFDSQKDSPALANLAGLFARCVGPHKGVSG
jgi:hypothetical protein